MKHTRTAPAAPLNPLHTLFAVRRLATPAFAASGYAGPVGNGSALDDDDWTEQLQQAERADWVLLRLVVCAAAATLLLAAALRLAG